MVDREYRRLVVARPTISVGKELGFLPGSLEEKLNPWMQPIHDALEMLSDLNMGQEQRRSMDLMRSGQIVVEALSYIRGRSIAQQFMIIDEAQNLTPLEVKTIVTRVGQGTKIVFTGDPYQIDNPYVDSSIERLQLRGEQVPGAGHRRARRAAEGRAVRTGGTGGEPPVGGATSSESEFGLDAVARMVWTRTMRFAYFSLIVLGVALLDGCSKKPQAPEIRILCGTSMVTPAQLITDTFGKEQQAQVLMDLGGLGNTDAENPDGGGGGRVYLPRSVRAKGEGCRDVGGLGGGRGAEAGDSRQARQPAEGAFGQRPDEPEYESWASETRVTRRAANYL